MDIRTGIGIDFHRLLKDQKRKLIIGGYHIESDWALLGHSDADLVLHALSDAILGALGDEDIGEFFPDTNEEYKNIDSKEIIELALTKMKEKNFSLSNVDLNIIGESPRMAPHKKNIKQSLTQILRINTERISIKANTAEKMGALGREEGLACIANILLVKNNG